MQKLYTIVASLLFLVVALPGQAKTTDSDRLQNLLDSFEHKVSLRTDALTVAYGIQLTDEEQADLTTDEQNTELANQKYTAAYSQLTAIIPEIQAVKKIHLYLNLADKKDSKAIRLSAQNLIIQMKVYLNDMDTGLSELGDNPSAGLNDVTETISNARSYLDSHQRDIHDTTEKYLGNEVNALLDNYQESLDQLAIIYDNYVIVLGEGQITTVADEQITAQAKYSEGLALYGEGLVSDEVRDVQLLNQALKKMQQTSSWLGKAYSTIEGLEDSI